MGITLEPEGGLALGLLNKFVAKLFPCLYFRHCEVADLTAKVARLEKELALFQNHARVCEIMNLNQRLLLEVDELKESAEKFKEHASRDPLTGLLNRRGFESALHRQIGTIQRYIDQHGGVFYPPYLAYIDLDQFKKVNDICGHEEGDKILLVVTGILKKFCHRDTNPVCRQGGDEFLVLFTSSTEAQVLTIVESIRKSIEENRDLQEHSVTASIGIAKIDISQNSMPGEMDIAYKECSAHADRAMYHSKRIGRNVITLTDGAAFRKSS